MKTSPALLFAIIIALSVAAFGQPNIGLVLAQYYEAADAVVSPAGPLRTRLTSEHSTKPKSPAEVLEQHAFSLVNAERAGRGLPPLQWSATVASVARLHSQNMAGRNFFSHQGLDGLLVDERAERAGLSGWSAIGENIAFLFGRPNPAEFAIEQWMRSPAHRDNLLGTRWKESAIGIAITEDGKYYFTQVFIVR